MDLIKKAKSRKSRNELVIDDQHIDLALSYLNDEVSLSDVTYALGKESTHHNGTYIFLTRALKEARKRGKV
jgi:hypothetical protein